MSAPAHLHPSSAVQPEEEAARWIARRDAGLSSADEAEFQSWRSADIRNAAAWQEVESAWQAFDRTRRAGLAEDMVRRLAKRRHRRRWKASLAVAATLTAAAIVVMLTPPDASRGTISRIEQRVLADGSVVELNRGAEIAVNFQPGRREVHLVRGEALFTVAKESARPFIVSTGRVDVQAIGTAFAVRTTAEAVDVVVTEGRVAVERTQPGRGSGQKAAATSAAVLVGAGDRLLVPAAANPAEHLQVEPLAAADIGRRLAWRGPRIELSATRLRDALTLFNRENRLQLRVTDRELGELRLSGVFRADDAEGFVRLLAANYEVRAETRGGEIVLRGK